MSQEANSYFPPEKDISYSPGMDSVRETIVARAKELGLTLKALSLGAGKSHSYVQQFIERGVPKKLPEDVRASLAAQLGLSEDALGKPAAEAGLASIVRHPALIPRAALVGADDLPVYAAAEGGSGHLIVTFDPIQYVRRPEMLLHVRDG